LKQTYKKNEKKILTYKCNNNIHIIMTTRKQRGLTQNLYLINFDAQNNNNQEKKFSVLGSTGNIYTVNIKSTPTCTCPDYTTRHNRCKHIYFILLRVMLINPNNVENKKYTDNELTKMFSDMQQIANFLYVPEALQKEYNINGILNASQNITVPMRMDEELCPICLDEINNGEELDYCKYACGNPVHKQCFNMWIKNNKNPTCVLCRSKW